MRRGTQIDVMSPSVTTSPPVITTTAIKGFKYKPPKQEDDNDEDEDVNFVEDEARGYGWENVGVVSSLPYLMP